MLTPPSTQSAVVVDDAEPVRRLIGAVLAADGYQVDEAGSLAEARQLDLVGYDAILVDAQLGGGDRGADLVAGLREEDPGAVRRCLLLSGGLDDDLPADVATLPKPFGVEDLLTAVHQLSWQDGGALTRPKELTWAEAVEHQTHAGWVEIRHILGIAGALRERERLHLALFLHDGPIQELTAVLLSLGTVRHSMPPEAAARLGELEDILSSTMSSLREELAAWRPHARSTGSVAAALRQRIVGLLAESLTVETEAPTPLDPNEIASVIGFVELTLLEIEPNRAVKSAHVFVHADDTHITVLLTTPRGGTDRASTSARRARLTMLADMLGARVGADNHTGRWEVRIQMFRSAATTRPDEDGSVVQADERAHPVWHMHTHDQQGGGGGELDSGAEHVAGDPAEAADGPPAQPEAGDKAGHKRAKGLSGAGEATAVDVQQSAQGREQGDPHAGENGGTTGNGSGHQGAQPVRAGRRRAGSAR
jgi:DNA-binding response OmpR family regulator